MTRVTTKAGRLLLLYRLREAGVLGDDHTLQEIGDALGVNRSTILRDLRVLDRVEEEYRRLVAEQPWTARELTPAEFAAQIGVTPETVRVMLRDGLIQAHKRGSGRGRWRIPVEELRRWLDKLRGHRFPDNELEEAKW